MIVGAFIKTFLSLLLPENNKTRTKFEYFIEFSEFPQIRNDLLKLLIGPLENLRFLLLQRKPKSKTFFLLNYVFD